MWDKNRGDEEVDTLDEKEEEETKKLMKIEIGFRSSKGLEKF